MEGFGHGRGWVQGERGCLPVSTHHTTTHTQWFIDFTCGEDEAQQKAGQYPHVTAWCPGACALCRVGCGGVRGALCIIISPTLNSKIKNRENAGEGFDPVV